MKVYATDKIRNIGLVSHQGAGKTSLAEAFLFNAGAINRIGTVEQGNTTSDHDDEEISRGISLSTALLPVEIGDVKINFLDTPGYTDFQGDVKNTLRVSDLALILLDASAGVEVGMEVYWGNAGEFGVPRMIVANKMNRDNARSADEIIEELNVIFQTRFVALQLPVGSQADFAGVIDLLTMTALTGEGATPGDIPADLLAAAEEARMALVEAAAESDDALLEKYFEEGDLSPEEIIKGVREGIKNNTFVPVTFAAATANIGPKALLDLLVKVAPSPSESPTYLTKDGNELSATANAPLAVYVFKTAVDPFVGKLTYFRVISGTLKADSRIQNHTRNEEERIGPLLVMRGKDQNPVDTLHAGDIGAVAKLNVTITGDSLGEKNNAVELEDIQFPQPIYAVAVTPATQGDSAKMGPTLTRLCDEDQTLQWRQDPVTREAVLEGMGDVHIGVAIKRAKALGVSLETMIPKVPYKETITKPATSEYTHKKQSGGAGQYARVVLRVEPFPDGKYEYASEVFGGAISQQFIPSIDKGIKGMLEEGVLAGYPVVEVRAVVVDGKEHPVDSKDIAFQIAGREAFKTAFRDAGPVLLEPIMRVIITVPETDMGNIMGDLSSRRGQPQDTNIIARKAIVTAEVPHAEMQRYSNDLRSMTQGRGVYSMEFVRYQKMPTHLADEIIAKVKLTKEETH